MGMVGRVIPSEKVVSFIGETCPPGSIYPQNVGRTATAKSRQNIT